MLFRLAGDTGDYVAIRTFRASDTREFFGLGQLSNGQIALAGSSESVLFWAQGLPPVTSMGPADVDDVVLGLLVP